MLSLQPFVVRPAAFQLFFALASQLFVGLLSAAVRCAPFVVMFTVLPSQLFVVLPSQRAASQPLSLCVTQSFVVLFRRCASCCFAAVRRAAFAAVRCAALRRAEAGCRAAFAAVFSAAEERRVMRRCARDVSTLLEW